MKIRKLEASDTRNEIICEAFHLSDIDSFDDLVATYDEYAKKFPGHCLLISLDDLPQAQYTSSHTIETHDLDDTGGHDLSGVDACAFEDGEHIGYLSTPSEFFIRERNFIERAKGVTFADACAKGLRMDEEEFGLIEGLHDDPMPVLDAEVQMWAVPVQDPALSLAAFPNGYFSVDLSPLENYALAAHLHARYALRLFGIGAACIAFRRDSPLGAAEAQALADDLCHLYTFDSEDEYRARLVAMLTGRKFVFLCYSDELNW